MVSAPLAAASVYILVEDGEQVWLWRRPRPYYLSPGQGGDESSPYAPP